MVIDAQPELPGLVKEIPLRDVCEHGGWFCQREQVFTVLAMGAEEPTCARCGSSRVRLCPPIFN